MSNAVTVAILGGTGSLGFGLAIRWLATGYTVVIGSRDKIKANETVLRLKEITGSQAVSGMDNCSATRSADIVVLTVPFSAHASVLAAIREHVQGKIVIETTVPLVPPKVSRVHLPEGNSVALRTQAELGSNVRVVAAFHHVAAAKLADPHSPIDCDVMICGDDPQARAIVSTMVEAAGLGAIEAGPLANAVALETLTPLLIWMNSNRKTKGAGIRITGR